MNSRGPSSIEVVMLFVAFTLLPLFEWRFVRYNFIGERSVSPFVIPYLLLAIPSIASLVKRCFFCPNLQKSKIHITPILVMYAALAIFSLSWFVFSVDMPSGANRFTIFGGLMLFLATNAIFLNYTTFVWSAVIKVASYTSLLYLLAYLLLLALNSSSLTNYEDVVNSATFIFPVRPYQVASILTFATLLGSGVYVGSNRVIHVIWIVPIMGYLVTSTGSRSGTVGFWVLWCLFCTLSIHQRIRTSTKPAVYRLALKFICSLILGWLAVTILPNTKWVDRASMVRMDAHPSNPSNFVDSQSFNGSARDSLWRLALESEPASGKEPKLGKVNFGSFHNVLLDIYIGGGYFPLVAFTVFLLAVMVGLFKSIPISCKHPDRMMRYALLLCFVELVFQALVNPMLSFSAAWIMLGIIAASISSKSLIRNV